MGLIFTTTLWPIDQLPPPRMPRRDALLTVRISLSGSEFLRRRVIEVDADKVDGQNIDDR